MSVVEAKFHVENNSKIKDIYSKLNSVQKKAIVLFDTDRNGTMDAKECKAFNSSIFSEQANGDLDIYLQLSSGKKQKTTVKQNEFDNTILSLERVQSEKIEQKNGKNIKVKTVSDSLNKSRTLSISQKIYDITNGCIKVSEDANGNSRYEYKSQCMNSQNKVIYVTDYRILDKTGNLIEAEHNCFIHSNEGDYNVSCGKILYKDNKTYYYDRNNNLNGIIEQQKDKKLKYSDAKGNVLYYTQNKSKYLHQKSSLEPFLMDTTYYYDKNQNLYAIVPEKYYMSGNTTVGPVEFYEKGKLVAIKNNFEHVDPNSLSASELENFSELSRDELGIYYDSNTSFRSK